MILHYFTGIGRGTMVRTFETGVNSISCTVVKRTPAHASSSLSFFIASLLTMVKISNSHSETINPLDVFKLCRLNKWYQVHGRVRQDPWIAVTPLTMDNNISTTILHQAISSKSDTHVRAAVIETVLELAPKAASMRNGYGSLPLHVITQRNTKMDSKTKERLIVALINAYPKALVEVGGVGGRTPLHIVFTDYISADIIRTMITMAPKACFMRDKKGWLPIHMACSRHCSPEKLRMLLEANPASLHAKTPEGESLLCLAKSRATKTHPNYALISEIKAQLKSWKGDEVDNDPRFEAASVAGNDPPCASSVVTPETFHRVHFQPKSEAPSLGDAPADLLLHFHRTSNLKDDQAEAFSGQYAEV